MKREDQAKEVLTMFTQYLEDHGIGERTRLGYANSISKMIRVYVKNDGNLTSEEIADHESSLARTSRNLFRVAWKHFRTFCVSEGAPPPPEAKSTALGASRQDVADAARYVSSQMSVKQIYQQRWDGVRYENGRVIVATPDQSVFLFAGQHAVDAFQTLGYAYYEMAHPTASYPLIPMRAFDTTALSTTSLRLLIRRGKAIRLKEDVEIPPEILAIVTSMLAKGVEPLRIMRALSSVYTVPTPDPIAERIAPQVAGPQRSLEEELEAEKETVDPAPAPEVKSPPRLSAMPTFAQWKGLKSPQE